jgi:hypothetical protein
MGLCASVRKLQERQKAREEAQASAVKKSKKPSSPKRSIRERLAPKKVKEEKEEE